MPGKYSQKTTARTASSRIAKQPEHQTANSPTARTPNSKMAAYHCSVKKFTRTAGQSACAAASYRSGGKMIDERTGQIHDYTRKQGIESATLFMPAHAPMLTREQLWNAVEKAENRKNSTVAREFEIALPAELNRDQRQALAHEFAQALVAKYGFAADCAIHAPSKDGDDRNYHAHILASTRVITATGIGEKTRVLDDKTTGPEQVIEVRELLATLTNRALENAGVTDRVSHLSLEAQGIDREPTIHLGPAATAIERRGDVSQKTENHQERQREQQQRVADQQRAAEERERIAVEHAIAQAQAEAAIAIAEARASAAADAAREQQIKQQAAEAARIAAEVAAEKAAEEAKRVAEIAAAEQAREQQIKQQAAAEAERIAAAEIAAKEAAEQAAAEQAAEQARAAEVAREAAAADRAAIAAAAAAQREAEHAALMAEIAATKADLIAAKAIAAEIKAAEIAAKEAAEVAAKEAAAQAAQREIEIKQENADESIRVTALAAIASAGRATESNVRAASADNAIIESAIDASRAAGIETKRNLFGSEKHLITSGEHLIATQSVTRRIGANANDIAGHTDRAIAGSERREHDRQAEGIAGAINASVAKLVGQIAKLITGIAENIAAKAAERQRTAAAAKAAATPAKQQPTPQRPAPAPKAPERERWTAPKAVPTPTAPKPTPTAPLISLATPTPAPTPTEIDRIQFATAADRELAQRANDTYMRGTVPTEAERSVIARAIGDAIVASVATSRATAPTTNVQQIETEIKAEQNRLNVADGRPEPWKPGQSHCSWYVGIANADRELEAHGPKGRPLWGRGDYDNKTKELAQHLADMKSRTAALEAQLATALAQRTAAARQRDAQHAPAHAAANDRIAALKALEKITERERSKANAKDMQRANEKSKGREPPARTRNSGRDDFGDR